MGRQFTRMVQTTDSNIVVANTRVQEEEIQLFDLSGPAYAIDSGPWLPKRRAVLTSWYAASSTVGTSDLWVVLHVGDMLFNQEGEQVGLLILPAASKVVSGPITYGDQIYNYPTISPNQWMSVSLSGASGHTNVAVQFYGKYM